MVPCSAKPLVEVVPLNKEATNSARILAALTKALDTRSNNSRDQTPEAQTKEDTCREASSPGLTVIPQSSRGISINSRGQTQDPQIKDKGM